jgi:hypothetical protein
MPAFRPTRSADLRFPNPQTGQTCQIPGPGPRWRVRGVRGMTVDRVWVTDAAQATGLAVWGLDLTSLYVQRGTETGYEL